VPFSYSKFFMKQLQMYAVVGAQGEDDLVSFHKALDWIARREIDVTTMVSHRFMGKAMSLAHERDEDALKVTLTF
jgi:threonine dehydrogenase-like Zn-dependent dehydrogenase